MLLKDDVPAELILILLALPVAMLAGGLILLRVSLKTLGNDKYGNTRLG